MSETVEFTIGAEVFCEEGTCGVLRRVVIDPIARAITHLVVDPQQGQNLGHLVPIDRVDTSKDEIRLRCTMAEFEALEDAEETQFLQGGSGQWGYGQGQTLLLPFFGLGMRGMGMGGMGMGGMGMGGMGMGGMGMGMGGIGMRGQGMGPQAVTRDRVPVGEVEVRRGDHVSATDGPIGRVQGLVIDASDYHVTHVLLDEGHMWGKKEVSIPISAVIGVDDAVRLNLTKNEVRDLPPVDVGHHD
jgi:sporulation protein YlmC with PRC-barrel domain